MHYDYAGLLILVAPEAVLTVAALAALFMDMTLLRGVGHRERMLVGAVVVILGCLVSALVMVAGGAGSGAAPGGMQMGDALTRWAKLALLALTAAAAGVSLGGGAVRHPGEYGALLLVGAVGMMLLVGSENLLMLFVALELTSVVLYVLAAFATSSRQSVEGAAKYFLYGSVAAAFALFGFSLLYGATGTLELRAMGVRLREGGLDATVAVALAMVLAGFGFKVAAVPFHLWAPDVYQGAPTPAAAFIASSSKLAGFVILSKTLLVGFAGMGGAGGWGEFVPGWVPLLAVMAAFSVVLGNLAALAQSSVKRLLAYSAVAHAGYTLVGLASDSLPGLASVLYYSATYAVAALGAFGVVAVVEDVEGEARMEAFAGLGRRFPVLAFCLTVFLLSLAGIPPLAGFFGKFYLFSAALEAREGTGLLWLVVLAIAMSAVSLYYYLLVLKQVYVGNSPDDAPRARVSGLFQGTVVVLAGVTVALGVWPHWVLGPLSAAVAGL